MAAHLAGQCTCCRKSASPERLAASAVHAPPNESKNQRVTRKGVLTVSRAVRDRRYYLRAGLLQPGRRPVDGRRAAHG
jgi:hypothetical protein